MLTSWVEVRDDRRLEHLNAIILTTPVRGVFGPAKQDHRLQKPGRVAPYVRDGRGDTKRQSGMVRLVDRVVVISDTYHVRLVTRAVKDINAAYRPEGGDDLPKHGCVSEMRQPLHDNPGAGFRRNEPRLRKVSRAGETHAGVGV